MIRNIYAGLWIAWIAMFLAVELTAIVTGHTQYTLSDFTWRLENLGPQWTFLRYVVAVFCIWLGGHMIFGWWR